MAFRDHMQASRFELKYLIDEGCARAVRDYAQAYLVPDPYALHRPNHEYPIHSLYLDSPDYHLCRATVYGHKNRFKLRIRFYDENPEHPCFCEIKRRVDAVILKQRAPVRRESLARLFAGHMPCMSDLFGDNYEKFGALETFWGLAGTLRADGKAFVSYIREAYTSPDDESVRLTFDRDLAGSAYKGEFRLADPSQWIRPPVKGVVLEIKFTNRFPAWLQAMVQNFNLQRQAFAKYVRCVYSMLQPGRPLRDPLVQGIPEVWL